MIRVWGSRLAIVAVSAIAIAVGIDALFGDGRDVPTERAAAPKPELVGPAVPEPGTLAGTLTVTAGDGCRLQTVTLADASLGNEGPKTACDLWAAPAGRLAR